LSSLPGISGNRILRFYHVHHLSIEETVLELIIREPTRLNSAKRETKIVNQ
jgi:hypothetical protein